MTVLAGHIQKAGGILKLAFRPKRWRYATTKLVVWINVRSVICSDGIALSAEASGAGHSGVCER